MSHNYRTIEIPVGVATNELIEFILEHPFSDMSLGNLKKYVIQSRENEEKRTGIPVTKPLPTTAIDLLKEFQSHAPLRFQFSTEESNADDHWQEALCIELRARNIPYQYFADYDEHNNDISLWTPKGSVTYDVDVEGDPIVPYDKIAEIMDKGITDSMKLQQLHVLLETTSPYGLPTIDSYSVEKVAEISVIDKILERLDNGEITQDQAFKEISDYKLKKGA